MLSRPQLKIEKMRILDRANKHFHLPAKIITENICRMSHVTDGYNSIKGYSLDLEQQNGNIEESVKKQKNGER